MMQGTMSLKVNKQCINKHPRLVSQRCHLFIIVHYSTLYIHVYVSESVIIRTRDTNFISIKNENL